MVAHDTSSTPDKATDRAGQHKPRTPLRRAIALPADTSKVVRFVLRRAGEKKLTQVASSLTFTTVLSIVPMLAVVLALFTAFPLFGEFRLALEDFLTTNLMPPAVSDNVMLYLNQFAAKASGLTAIGSLFLFVTSISLIMTIDEAFNDIWQVEQQRPMRQRMLVYWAIVSLGPILAGASLWATSLLARESLGHVDDLPTSVGFALSFIPLVATGLGFTALFCLVPNRKVLWRDALIGGLGTAIVLEIMRTAFAFYLTRFPSYTVIYGAFATLPIFLLWIYMSWLVILVGATVAAILPSIRQRRWALEHYTGDQFIDSLRVLRVLWETQANNPCPGCSIVQLCERLQLHQDETASVLKQLKDLGYVVDTLENDDQVWVLACDQRSADLGPLLDAMLVDRKQPGMHGNRELLDAIAITLTQAPMRLETLFHKTALPESQGIGQNTIKTTQGQEHRHVES
ncbi:YihY family inner membrane protein [Allopusillimonas ginsengisoli]|uniref:YihY family inner membrane protein n=1 Tax=Allopusillimonas ginsengisoli TaxID=453575 RepID=UPI001021F572|nr:YihY family inner membrane protein [Allopusillimonas ginsengisoli]TEA70330.1 YihY family inner membrane protein [Allopusillimonas ginsengisoli]